MKENAVIINLAGLTEEDIVNRIYLEYHQPEREVLKELEVLVNRILLAHYLHGKETVLMLHRNVCTLKMLLEEHFAKEEKELFRAIRRADKTEENLEAIRKGIVEMEKEHQEIIAILQETREKTNNFTLPEYSCPTMENAYNKLNKLSEDIMLQIDIERKDLFSRFK